MVREFELTTKSVNSLIRDVDSLINELESGKILGKVARESKNELKNRVDTISNYDGNDIGKIESILTENEFELLWSGEQVAFLEFGTGVIGKMARHPDLPSEWVYGSGKSVNKDGSWVYNSDMGRIRTFGIPAYAPMYYTGVKAREILVDRYKEVLNAKFRGRN